MDKDKLIKIIEDVLASESTNITNTDRARIEKAIIKAKRSNNLKDLIEFATRLLRIFIGRDLDP